MIEINQLNEVYVRINCDQGQRKEIEEKFSFKVPHYVPSKTQFAWLKRRAMKQPLVTKSGCLPIGLLPTLAQYLDGCEYPYKITGEFGSTNFSEVEALEFIKSLNIPSKYEVRDYQLKYFIKSVRNRRCICIAPTNCGKTLLTYLLFRYFNCKTLITVPTTTLVWQTIEAFKEYGYNSDDIHGITAGVDKTGMTINLETEDGNRYNFLGNEYITLINRERKQAKDLLETDEIDDRWIQTQKRKQIS